MPRENDSFLSLGAVDGYELVDTEQDALRVVEVGNPESTDPEIYAYRESTTERWFFSRQACDAAKDVAVPPRSPDSYLRGRFL
jgi:hypothetical protein